MNRLTRIVALTGLLVLPGPVFAWWDTICKKWTLPPLVERWEAETPSSQGVTDDVLSSAGKAVRMTEEGPTLTVEAELSASVYGVYVYGRSPRDSDVGDPGGLEPFYFRVTVRPPGDAPEASYRVRAAYQYVYPITYGAEDMVRVFFRVDRPGTYRIDVAPGAGTTSGPLLVDRLELRDVLGNCAKRRGKTARTMRSDDALRNLRGGRLDPPPMLPADQVASRCQAYWASFPPANAPRQETTTPGRFSQKDRVPPEDALKGWSINALDEPWVISHKTHGRYALSDFLANRPLPGPVADKGWGVTVTGLTRTGSSDSVAYAVNGTFSVIGPIFKRRVEKLAALMSKKAAEYERTGNAEAGLDGAALLLAFAYHYPMLDYRSQANWIGAFARFGFTNHIGGGIVKAGLLEGHAVRAYVTAYDQLYDFIVANPALTQFLTEKVASVKGIDDVITFLDVNLLQRTADVILRGDVAGDPLKMSRALTMCAICQGVNDISQKWVDILFREIPMGMIEPGGLEDMAYGALGRDGLVSKGSGGYSKGSIMSFLEVATSLREYRDAGGRIPADLTDLQRYPWFGDALSAPIELRVAGGWVPLIGDYGDPLRKREVFFDRGPTGGNALKPFYLTSWRLTKDPTFANLTYRYGRTVEPAEAWQALEAVARTVRDPLNTLPSRILDDFGLAILESGQESDDFATKHAVTLRYGHGHTHGHNDGLAISVFGKGTRAISDLAARAGDPSPRLQKMHSTVEVDGKSLNNGDLLMAGWGWLEAFVPMGAVQYVEARQRARSHPQLDTYRRGVALINVDEDDSYVFNVFRVAGGRMHTWCAHANQNDHFELNAELKPATSPAARAYLDGFKTPDTQLGKSYQVAALLPEPMEGVAPEALVATWRLHPRAEQAFRGESMPPGRRIHARWRLFGHAGDRVYAANGTSETYRYDMSFLYVQEPDAADAGSVYPSLAEVYEGDPIVQSARSLTVKDAGDGAASTVAVAVSLPDDVTDVCLSGPADGRVRAVEGGLRFDGLFGFVRRDEQGLVRADLVGGTMLAGEGFSLSSRPRLEAEVVAIDPRRNACTVEGDLTEANIVGRTVLLRSPDGRSYAYTVKAVQLAEGGSTTVVLRERMKIFQSAIEHLDEKTGALSVVAEPYSLKADQYAYDATEAANESLTKRWPAKIVTNTRWMVVKTPMDEADIPDADGDGVRTLSLMGSSADGDRAGESLIRLEVTRVNPKERLVYFRMPPPPYDVGGWQYVGRDLVSESGKRWRGTYPGFEYKIMLDGPAKTEDFDDADGDGRRTISLYRFRPGFRMVVPTFVSVVRSAPGKFKVQSLVKARVSVPVESDSPRSEPISSG